MSQILRPTPSEAWKIISTVSNITPGAFPLDDTLPQITEGTEIIPTTTINLKSASSKVLGRLSLCGVPSVSVAFLVLAAFRGAQANAVGGSVIRESAEYHTYDLMFIDEPETAGDVSYTIRMGISSGDFCINGSAGLRFWGGAIKTTLHLKELLP